MTPEIIYPDVFDDHARLERAKVINRKDRGRAAV
jgi:hypothetical protein